MNYIIIIIALAILAQTTYLVVASSSRNKRAARQSIYVDTSVLIDGRILSIAEAGFIPGELVIPRSVLRELQLLADGADSDKRAKARKGLDLVRKLQDVDDVAVRIFQDGYSKHGVDEQLIDLAKKYQGSICTVDYNLNKVAQVEGIMILNINELAKNIRSVYLPGERTTIELVAKGQDSHQGVGYLEDGTMVVVEKAAKQVGSKVEVEFIRVLQTDAGKMLFAKLVQQKLRDSRSDAQPIKKITRRKSLGRRSSDTKKKSTKSESATETGAPRAASPRRRTNNRNGVESTRKDASESQTKQSTQKPKQPRRRKTQEDSLLAAIDKQE